MVESADCDPADEPELVPVVEATPTPPPLPQQPSTENIKGTLNSSARVLKPFKTRTACITTENYQLFSVLNTGDHSVLFPPHVFIISSKWWRCFSIHLFWNSDVIRSYFISLNVFWVHSFYVEADKLNLIYWICFCFRYKFLRVCLKKSNNNLTRLKVLIVIYCLDRSHMPHLHVQRKRCVEKNQHPRSWMLTCIIWWKKTWQDVVALLCYIHLTLNYSEFLDTSKILPQMFQCLWLRCFVFFVSLQRALVSRQTPLSWTLASPVLRMKTCTALAAKPRPPAAGENLVTHPAISNLITLRNAAALCKQAVSEKL